MPAKRADYVPIPYAGQPYQGDNGNSRTLAQILLQRGDAQAAMHLQRGDNQARAFAQAGNVINNAVQGWQQNVELNRQRELDAAKEARAAQAQGMQIEASGLALDEAKRAAKGREFTRQVLPLARREDGLTTYDRGILQREFDAAGMSDQLPEVFAKLDEQDAAHLKVLEAKRDAVAGDAFRVLQGGGDEAAYDGLLQYWKENDALPARELKAMRELGKNPEQRQQALLAAVSSSPRFAQMLKRDDPVKLGANERLVDPRSGQTLIDAAPPEQKPPTSIEAAILEAERSGDSATVQRLLGMKKDIAAAGRAPGSAPAPEPLVAIVGPDGQPVLVPRSEAAGRKPASTRETGRQVTSGDAGDIAEFNTALDDVDTLRETLKGNAATGASAQVGAALPNAVTEFTGWGSDAKKKQAVIDRVKQVIGKALEGGVLRKEDETKYAKILPTIGDPPDVVDAKLAGLRSALAQRQQRKLDALESAGYDVSRFGGKPAAGGGEWQDVGGFKVRVKP